MENTRDHFKKIGEIKEIFHERIGKIKDRNDKYLTEAEESKKRWQECTNYTIKIFVTQITRILCSLTSSQTSWNVKSSGPLEALLLLQTKLVEVTEF